MGFEEDAIAFAIAVQGRLVDLVKAPFENSEMLWAAIPLFAAILFMALYFGRYRKEELGWDSAFANNTIFLFTAINIIRQIYDKGGSWDAVFASKLYLTMSIALAGGSIVLMMITYFHLIPKKIAFFLFSEAPVDVTAYVIMAMVFAHVPPDIVTVAAGLVFLILILIAIKAIKFVIGAFGLRDDEFEEGDVAHLEKIEEEEEEAEEDLEHEKEKGAESGTSKATKGPVKGKK
jgi:signal transduction histidine kinase